MQSWRAGKASVALAMTVALMTLLAAFAPSTVRSAVLIADATPVPESNGATSTPTRTRTPTPTATPFVPLQLGSMCSPSPAAYRVWRVRNYNTFAMPFNWGVVTSQQVGAGTAPAASGGGPGEAFFQATTVPDDRNITMLFHKGVVQSVKEGSALACATPTPAVTHTPTASASSTPPPTSTPAASATATVVAPTSTATATATMSSGSPTQTATPTSSATSTGTPAAATATATASPSPTGTVSAGTATPTPSATPPIVGSPDTVIAGGSSTVTPIIEAAQAPFTAAWAPGPAGLQLTGGGTSDLGIQSVLCGTVDVGLSSRQLRPTEPDCRGVSQDVATRLDVWPIARDATVVVITDDPSFSGVTGITIAQLRGIYEGSIAMWDALGGPPTAIVPRARQLGSGSRADLLTQTGAFEGSEAAVVAGTGLPRLLTPTAAAEAIACNPGQVAYVSMADVGRVCPGSPARGLKVLPVGGVSPSVATLSGGVYPLTRTLYLATRRVAWDDTTIKARMFDLINFSYGATGRGIINGLGFVALASPTSDPPVPDHDVTLSGRINLSDVGAMFPQWLATNTSRGWIRQDVTNDGRVDLSDVGALFPVWDTAGFRHPVFP